MVLETDGTLTARVASRGALPSGERLDFVLEAVIKDGALVRVTTE